MLDITGEINRLSLITQEEVCCISGGKSSQQVDSAVYLYNHAVDNLKMKSDDIAAIELKKAISTLPGFVAAKVLLGLCYLESGQIEEAETILRSVTEGESATAKAYRYLRHIEAIKQPEKRGRRTPPVLKRQKESSRVKPLSSLGNILKTGGAFLAGATIVYLLMSFQTSATVEGYISENALLSQNQEEYMQKLQQAEASLAEAENTILSLHQQIKDAQQKLGYYTLVNQLLEIESIHGRGDRQGAAELLVQMNNQPFEGAAKEKFQGLYGSIMVPVAQQLYFQAYTHYTAARYDDALALFEKSLMYVPQEGIANRALYFAGRSLQNKGDAINAVNYFNRLINDFPNDEYAAHAANRLREMGAIQ